MGGPGRPVANLVNVCWSSTRGGAPQFALRIFSGNVKAGSGDKPTTIPPDAPHIPRRRTPDADLAPFTDDRGRCRRRRDRGRRHADHPARPDRAAASVRCSGARGPGQPGDLAHRDPGLHRRDAGRRHPVARPRGLVLAGLVLHRGFRDALRARLLRLGPRPGQPVLLRRAERGDQQPVRLHLRGPLRPARAGGRGGGGCVQRTVRDRHRRATGPRRRHRGRDRRVADPDRRPDSGRHRRRADRVELHPGQRGGQRPDGVVRSRARAGQRLEQCTGGRRCLPGERSHRHRDHRGDQHQQRRSRGRLERRHRRPDRTQRRPG